MDWNGLEWIGMKWDYLELIGMNLDVSCRVNLNRLV